MTTVQRTLGRIEAYARAHLRDMRFLCFFAAFWFVWMQADNLASFVNGFFDALSDVEGAYRHFC